MREPVTNEALEGADQDVREAIRWALRRMPDPHLSDLHEHADACIALHRRRATELEHERDAAIDERDAAALEGARLREAVRVRDRLLARAASFIAEARAAVLANETMQWAPEVVAVRPFDELLEDIGRLDAVR